MSAWHTKASPWRDDDPAADAHDSDPRARLAQLDHRARTLERERLVSRPTRARLVALDVELCRVEAARRMLAAATEPET